MTKEATKSRRKPSPTEAPTPEEPDLRMLIDFEDSPKASEGDDSVGSNGVGDFEDLNFILRRANPVVAVPVNRDVESWELELEAPPPAAPEGERIRVDERLEEEVALILDEEQPVATPTPGVEPEEAPETGTPRAAPASKAGVAAPRVVDSRGRAEESAVARPEASWSAKSEIPSRGVGRSVAKAGRFLFDTRSVLGIDIGARSVKYVELRWSPRGLTLQDYGSREMSEDETLADSLRAIFQRKSLKSYYAVTCISGLEVIFRHLKVPKMPKKELREAIHWASRKEIPFPLESASLEYTILGDVVESGSVKQEVLVVVAQEKLIRKHLELLHETGLQPVKISTVPLALWRLVKQARLVDPNRCVIVIDIGASTSHMAFINQGKLQFVREITAAGDDFTEAITGTIFFEGHRASLEKEEAEALKRQYGIPEEAMPLRTAQGIPLSEVAVMMRPVLERLVNEIQRSMDYFKEKFRTSEIARIYLSGGGALMKNLVAHLSRELEVEVQLLNPLVALNLGRFRDDPHLRAVAPTLATTIGLALDSGRDLNLLPPELRASPHAHMAKRLLAYGGLLLGILATSLSLRAYFLSGRFEADLKRLQAEHQKVEPRIARFQALRSEVDGLQRKRDIYGKDIIYHSLAADHLRAVSNLVPPNIVLTWCSVETIDAASKQDGAKGATNRRAPTNPLPAGRYVRLHGVVTRGESMQGVTLAQFLMILEKSGYFSQVSLVSQSATDEYKGLAFEVLCRL